MKEMRNKPVIQSTALIFLCFLLTSTAWLAWEYHLMTLVPSRVSDLLCMVAGYLLQAAGIGVFAAVLRYRPSWGGRLFLLAAAAHMVCLIPAVFSPYPAGTAAFGLLMNLFCGILAGGYLAHLAETVGENRRGTAFGCGYGLSILASWILSRMEEVYYSGKVWLICAALTLALLWILRSYARNEKEITGKAPASDGRGMDPRLLRLACGLVLLFGIVNGSGFAFPAADLGGVINVEFSRLFYAAGLVIAGVVTDRSRRHGAICALTALIIPFILLALRGETVPTLFFWGLNYFTFGFYSVWRIVLFTDLAAGKKLSALSGFGLLTGRVGEALGEGLCIALESRLPILVCLAALFFAAAVAVFFRVYQSLYVPETTRQKSEQELFYQFALQHDLSSREREVLRQILAEKTNGEIADILSISENTVKFHIKNLLAKTGCRNRNDLIAVYYAR